MNPSLRGKPVAVVPSIVDTTSVIAASMEAKRFGVKTNTRVGDAKKMCPGIIFVSGSHQIYAEVHSRIVAAVEKILPVSAVLSIDEMACELMGSEQTEKKAIELSQEIKSQIRKDAGEYLSCSIGLAPNRYLAKVASDMQKPDGLVLIRKHELPTRLHELKLRDFPGIGAQMEKRIMRYGVSTVEQLCALSVQDMRFIWGGINGERFWHLIRGEHVDEQESQTKTIGHSHVLAPEYRNIEKAYLIAQKLLHKAAARLRKNNFWCAELSLHVSMLNHEDGFSASARLIECCDDLTLLEALREMWSKIPRWQRPVKVSIVLSRLVTDQYHTLNLFENPRRRNLAFALDSINQKYGKGTAEFASMKFLEKEAAPTRIAFTNIPDFSV